MPEESHMKFSRAIAAVIPIMLAFVYVYPRVVVAQLGTDSPWTWWVALRWARTAQHGGRGGGSVARFAYDSE